MICKACGRTIYNARMAGGWSHHQIIEVAKHREIERPEGVLIEQSPQLSVSVWVRRNGGVDEPICDGCVALAIEQLKQAI